MLPTELAAESSLSALAPPKFNMALVAAWRGCSKQLKFRQAASSFSPPAGVAAPLLPLPPPTAPSVSAAELMRIRVVGDEDEARAAGGVDADELASLNSGCALDDSTTGDSSVLQMDEPINLSLSVISSLRKNSSLPKEKKQKLEWKRKGASIFWGGRDNREISWLEDSIGHGVGWWRPCCVRTRWRNAAAADSSVSPPWSGAVGKGFGPSTKILIGTLRWARTARMKNIRVITSEKVNVILKYERAERLAGALPRQERQEKRNGIE